MVGIKLAVEAALFLASFLIQRDLIFSRKQGEATDWTSYYEVCAADGKADQEVQCLRPGGDAARGGSGAGGAPGGDRWGKQLFYAV
ncbi:MAG: hypothetical protein QM757_41600 [Paludibaculum sp.]